MPMSSSRGIIFTLDSILALTLTLSLITASLFYLGKTDESSFDEQQLRQLSLDSLAVLEKSSTLHITITTSQESLSSFINALPDPVCANITLFDAQGIAQQSVQKNSCTEQEITAQTIVTRRVFIVNNEVYYAEMHSWYE